MNSPDIEVDNTTTDADKGWYFTCGGNLYCFRPGRWTKAALVGVLLAAGTAALVYGFSKPEYEASAWIRIAQKQYIAFKSEEDPQRFVETQVQLIRSPLVLGPVVSQMEIAQVPELQERDAPIELLMQGISVSRNEESELLQISFRSVDKKAAADVCNAVVDAYLAVQDKEKGTQAERVIQLLEDEKSRRAHEVGRLRENVRELTLQATGVDPFGASPTPVGSAASTMNHPLASLQNELTAAEVNRKIAEAAIEAFEELMLGLRSKGTASSRGWQPIAFSGEKNDLEIKVTKPGQISKDITIMFVADRARRDLPIVSFDDETDTLTVDVDPTATTANAVIEAINSEGTCTARLDAKTDFRINATDSGAAFDEAKLVFVTDKAKGDQAIVTFDAAKRTLTVDIDPSNRSQPGAVFSRN